MNLKWAFHVSMILIVSSLVACQRNNTVCPEIVGTQEPSLQLADLIQEPPVPAYLQESLEVKIGGKMKLIDKLVDYPICNDSWSGIVYVSCDARVADVDLDEDSNSLFFKGCDLNIAPDTIVYVAAHNDTAYYKGCSCHTGEIAEP